MMPFLLLLLPVRPFLRCHVTNLAQNAAVDVDAGAPLQASTSGPPPSHAPGSLDIWVELTREQSKIATYLFRTTVVKFLALT